MIDRIEQLEKQAMSALSKAGATELEKLKNELLGRKGRIAELYSELAKLDPEMKKSAGAAINGLRSKIESIVAEKLSGLLIEGKSQKKQGVDVTLPGKKIRTGTPNVLSIVMDDLIEVFTSMGYIIAEGPEIETDKYNFESLNIPAGHPSKDMWSTFYLETGELLRTHTSPVQVRFMEKNKPPFAAIFPGKVFRRDAPDVTHLPVFHQLEGLAVAEGIKMSDLRGVLSVFVKKMFGKDRKIRFRPSYFPFTEPSAEVDVECFICGGKGCRSCKMTGWLEILGSGMVDPNVFKAVGYDPEKYSGFAFGMGIERIAMLKYGVDDIRLFFENDLRFLRQFA